MDFKVEGPWNTDKYCRSPWFADQKNFWILDALEWLKQKHFDFGDSLLIVSALKVFLFSFCFPFFFLLRKKWRAMAPSGPPVSPVLHLCHFCFTFILFVLNLIVQYLQNVVFSFEIGSNSQNQSSSDSHLSIKISSPH